MIELIENREIFCREISIVKILSGANCVLRGIVRSSDNEPTVNSYDSYGQFVKHTTIRFEVFSSSELSS